MMEFGELKRILGAFRDRRRFTRVRKFRSAAAMPPPPPLTPLDPENIRMACELSSLERLRPVRRTPGVRKFRSVEEMSRAQERAEADAAKNGSATSRSL
jgi:hypothetical protein